MVIVFYIFYFFVFLLVIKKAPFFRVSGVAYKHHAILFSYSALCGLAFVCIYKNILPEADMDLFFYDAGIIIGYIRKNPAQYMKLLLLFGGDIIPPDIAEPIYKMGHWGKMGNYLIVRLYAFFSMISVYNVYVISLFFSFMGYVGKVLLAKCYQIMYPEKNHTILLYSFFMILSAAIWTSSVHRETLLILGIGLVYWGLMEQKWNHLLSTLFGLFLVFLERDFTFYCVVLGIVFYYIAKYGKRIHWSLYVLLSLLFLLCAQFVPLYPYKSTIVEIIYLKKQEFIPYAIGNTGIPPLPFHANILEIIFYIPFALSNALIAFYSNTVSLPEIFTGIENFLVLLTLILFIIRFYTQKEYALFTITQFFTAGILLVCIGLIVPNIGAISRYKSISLIILSPYLADVLVFYFQNIKTYYKNKYVK